VSGKSSVVGRNVRLQKLESENANFAAALNYMSQGLVMFDQNSRLMLCNERYLELYGLAPKAVKPGCSLRELIEQRIRADSFSDGDPEQYIADLLAAIARGDVVDSLVELRDGRTIAVSSRQMPGGGWVATHDDITGRREAEQALAAARAQAESAEQGERATHELLNLVVENVPATLVVRDAHDGRYLLINRAAEKLYGVGRESMIGKTPYDLFPKNEAEAIIERDREVLGSGHPVMVDALTVHTPGMGTRVVKSKRLKILGKDGSAHHVLSFVEDVTERKEAEGRIAYLAHHDPLTDLANRAAFAEHLESAIAQAEQSKEPFAVLCIDLDRFKEVNDVFGHSMGDMLLREVSQRMRVAVDGAFLARVGGDEFSVVARAGTQASTAAVIGERLLGAVDDDLDIAGQRLRVGLSIGIAVFPDNGTDSATLLANADAALYRAKSEGRGTIRRFEADMDKRLRERRALQHDLRSAVENGELVVHYQPQALIGGEIIGFEALVRWHHPSHGTVPPDTFIPLAEESGLIMAIGEWVLREACREAASWPRELQIAVNLSPIQFRHGDLAGLVHLTLLETGLNPGRLQLEITEGVLIADFSRAVAILRRLKALGVKIAMDDFGTGYSSLSYLQAFPFDTIKIDQAFISSLGRDTQSAAIVRAVIGLARGLSVPVVAEGVETEEQLSFLAREACSEIQGFLVGKPRPIVSYSDVIGRPLLIDNKTFGGHAWARHEAAGPPDIRLTGTIG
jgi:diguanylate cyclase (GGDEF)-like protein/PAS domain S-box-containing protein